jgi:hypothetical protein
MRKSAIGAVISNDHLDACRWPDGDLPRDTAGHRRLIGWIGRDVVAFEAAGAYHSAFERAPQFQC